MSRQLHDSYLKSISFIDENTIEIVFLELNKNLSLLKLKGVSFFQCDDLKEGNIVFGLTVNRFDEEKLIALIEKKMNSKSDEAVNYIAEVQSGKLSFVSLESSYGAQIEAICEDWSINNLDKKIKTGK